MIKIISRLAVVAGFLFLAFSGCYLIRKSKVASEGGPSPAKRLVSGAVKNITKAIRKGTAPKDLSGLDLRGEIFEGLDLRGMNFQRSNLQGVNFRGSILQDVDFRGANLTKANLTMVYAPNADFRGAVLRDADCRGGNFRGANFTGADLRGAKMSDELREYARDQGAILD